MDNNLMDYFMIQQIYIKICKVISMSGHVSDFLVDCISRVKFTPIYRVRIYSPFLFGYL